MVVEPQSLQSLSAEELRELTTRLLKRMKFAA
jgi:transposase